MVEKEGDVDDGEFLVVDTDNGEFLGVDTDDEIEFLEQDVRTTIWSFTFCQKTN